MKKDEIAPLFCGFTGDIKKALKNLDLYVSFIYKGGVKIILDVRIGSALTR